MNDILSFLLDTGFGLCGGWVGYSKFYHSANEGHILVVSCAESLDEHYKITLSNAMNIISVVLKIARFLVKMWEFYEKGVHTGDLSTCQKMDL